ncbi:MAG: DUF2782 domain-containing protein [Azoarcus sp.]|jgi:hypothetical protein|nr:DUF2782 domain-containing protein [Azoarcus sp.]
MRTKLSAVLAAFAFCAGSMAAQPLLAQEPEEKQETCAEPEGLEPLDEELPQVTVVKRGEDTVTEFRIRGKLYMVKVTPPNGASYYLVDREGTGQFVRADGNRKLIVPAWVLTSW